MDTQDRFGTEYETPESQSYVGFSLEDALDAAMASGAGMYRVMVSSNGRRNGPTMMVGRTRTTNRWRSQHGRCSTNRA
jgi:hypothetical protein